MPKPTIIMSPPDFFAIEYSINPWMNTANQVDPVRAKREWDRLRSTYEDFGLKVLTIPPVKGLPDLVFTTDHGKWIGDTLYVSRFRYAVREKEQAVTLPWYKTHKVKMVTLPADHFMEGGDVLTHNDLIFVGHGYRTSVNTAGFLQQATGRKTIPLNLVNDAFYHLDTCFFPVRDTAFYYPTAFAPESLKVLRDTFPLLLPLSEHEAKSFVCNSVLIHDHILCEPCPSFETKMIHLGFTPIILEMHEFNKSGGGIHCLSQILD